MRLRSVLLASGLLLFSIAGLQFARTHVYSAPLPRAGEEPSSTPRREVLAVFKQPDVLLRPCNPDPLHLTTAQQARLEREQRRDEREGPDDFYVRPWKLPKEWQRKIIAAIPLSKGGIPWIRASRTWRKSIRAVFVADFVPSADVVQAGAGHGETFVYLNTSLIPTSSAIPNYYGKAAMVPSMAHEHGGVDDYKWMLYGDDDTLWNMDRVVEIIKDMDPELPHMITDHYWFWGKDALRPSVFHPAWDMPRCLPCGYNKENLDVNKSADTFDEPRMSFDPPLGCPYCSWELLAKNNAHQRPSLYTKDGQFRPRYPNLEPEGEVLAHGGGGIILSVGLLRRLPIEYIHSCIKGNFSHGQIYGGDTMFSHCVFWTGVAPTDPGYFLHDVHYNTFDHGGQLLLPIMNEYYRYFKKGFPNNTTCCKKQCQARLAHTTSHHVRGLHFKEPEIAIDTMKMMVRLRDTYLHLRRVFERKGGHAKLPELWDNHKSCF